MEEPPPERPVARIQIGRLSLTGRSAQIVVFVLFGLIGALIAWSRPTLRMGLTGGLWIAFLVYWSAAARNEAKSASSESPRSRSIHQLLLNGSLLLLFVPVPGLTRRFLPLAATLVPLGLAIQAAFFALAAWARVHLGRNWSGAITIKEGHALVRTGPYRLLRHPIYTAMLGMYAGTAIVSGELHAMLGLVIVTVAYARKIPLEERALLAQFGAEYDEYRRRTWAIVPGLY